MLTIPSVIALEEVQKAIYPGSVVAIYEKQSRMFSLYEIVQYIPFRYPLLVTIPPNTPSVTLAYNQVTFQNQTNPLYQFYNTPKDFNVLYIFGVSTNSPFVSLSATDPSGTPYWQLSSTILTRVYPESKIYSPQAWFVAISQLSPSITFNRRTETFTPYPLNAPLNFSAQFIGYMAKYKMVGTVAYNEVARRANVLVYLYSPFSEIYSAQGA